MLDVGVTGHRAVRLDAEVVPLLGPAIDAVLIALRDAAERALPALYTEGWLHTGLATGADQIAAAGARQAGFRVRAVLPFTRASYAKDFAEGTERREFERELALADATVELACPRDGSDAGYVRAGETIVAASDLLIAVWDGRDDEPMPGGTAHVVDLALKARLPVVHILVDRAARQVGPITLKSETDPAKPLDTPADYDALLHRALIKKAQKSD